MQQEFQKYTDIQEFVAEEENLPTMYIQILGMKNKGKTRLKHIVNGTNYDQSLNIDRDNTHRTQICCILSRCSNKDDKNSKLFHKICLYENESKNYFNEQLLSNTIKFVLVFKANDSQSMQYILNCISLLEKCKNKIKSRVQFLITQNYQKNDHDIKAENKIKQALNRLNIQISIDTLRLDTFQITNRQLTPKQAKMETELAVQRIIGDLIAGGITSEKFWKIKQDRLKNSHQLFVKSHPSAIFQQHQLEPSPYNSNISQDINKNNSQISKIEQSNQTDIINQNNEINIQQKNQLIKPSTVKNQENQQQIKQENKVQSQQEKPNFQQKEANKSQQIRQSSIVLQKERQIKNQQNQLKLDIIQKSNIEVFNTENYYQSSIEQKCGFLCLRKMKN